MSSIKDAQHYVWKHYLKPWSEQENIWAYLKTQNKIIKTSLKNVAQERHFYKLIDLSQEEEDFLKLFIERTCPPDLLPLNSDFLEIFTSHNKLKREYEKVKGLPHNKEYFEKELRRLEINLMEDAHGRMEALGFDFLKCRTLDDFKALKENGTWSDAMMFLGFQYFRTKKMRSSAVSSFTGKYAHLGEKCWNIISYTFATVLARALSLHPDSRFCLIVNNTGRSFLTSDQPVFNLLWNKKNQQGEVEKLELYYPITPSHAIRIYFDTEEKDLMFSKDADIGLVNLLNSQVLEYSSYYLFSNNKEQLEKLVNI